MIFNCWSDGIETRSVQLHSRGSEGIDNPGFDEMKPFEMSRRKRKGLPTVSYNNHPQSRSRRNCRNLAAHFFRHQYLYGSGMDRKTCIWSCDDNGDGDSWLDYSSGISWVGVHGSDSICVVTRTGVLDIKRACSIMKRYTIESFLQEYRKTLIAEIEELADPYRGGFPYPEPPNYLRESAEKSIKKPFGIVSVGTNEVPKECGVEAIEYDVKKAIKSIRERMESDVAFTKDETIQAAISAFQHLFGKKFKANEMGVTVFDKANYHDGKELDIHDIKKHLAVVNEPGSGGSTSSSCGRSTVTSVELEDEE